MSISTPTPESLKEKAKIIRKFISEKYNVDISQGHGLDLVSKLFGFADWNTASAALKPKEMKTAPPTKKGSSKKITTVGELKKALEAFDPSDSLDAIYRFKLIDFLKELEEDDSEDDEIWQNFSFTVKSFQDEFVSLELNLESEDMVRDFGGSFVNYRSLRS